MITPEVAKILSDLEEMMNNDFDQIKQEWGVSTDPGYNDPPEHDAMFARLRELLGITQ